ncbi:MAG: Riboflavin biosynthesis protein RibF [candidate division WS2 bacterium]|uniref:Riboflavin biosynthesis protein n=1 Tax=Psychracetigena formicireducens TaxID=2986056 RepID=A0A9E2BJJ6_PSYF1|nr:Riboflavin biosynthesis protein RibF [Candidatus Psychracetigena formicireducens]MBT9144264.1 Riboflavin biosynthesis protein RibF [Candidatus Psychracetigena formicireducens]MBT9150436.1 Riboflavin biosynthesis protein RibF [Candidatus Psychracetigena formicireducens]
MQSLVIIGSFDGVHLGHQQLIKEAKDRALKCGLLLTAITFEPQPSLFFNRTSKVLSSLEERLLLLKKYGVPRVEVVDFESVYNSTAEEFLRGIHTEMQVCQVVVGENFTFGKDKGGEASDLVKYASEIGMEARVVPLFSNSSGPISSSKIRILINEGKLEEANSMLGHPYLIYGVVVAGNKIGTQIGYETANMRHPGYKLLPPLGVYASWVNYKGNFYMGVLNIGISPTFNRNSIVPEVHILDYSQNLMGDFLEIYPVKYLREEKKFSGPEELRLAISRDIEKTRYLLNMVSVPDFMV